MGEGSALSPVFFMPLNEAFSPYSSLNQQQQHEAMEAIYGLKKEQPMTPQLTHDEFERMRQILAQHDAETVQKSMKEFDLNNPPVERYVFREYPFLMYNHQTGKTQPAVNHEVRQRMLAEGWTEEPFTAEPQEIPLTAAEEAEAEQINSKLKKRRA
jgi:hypothetical protein